MCSDRLHAIPFNITCACVLYTYMCQRMYGVVVFRKWQWLKFGSFPDEFDEDSCLIHVSEKL